MNAPPGAQRPLDSLRRLYEILDRLTWACMDLIELADDAAEQLPAISLECRNYVNGMSVVDTAAPGTKDGEPPFGDVFADWVDSHQRLLQAGRERIADYRDALVLLPELGRLRDQATDALPALRELAHDSDRAGLARLDHERKTGRPRPANRRRREPVLRGGSELPGRAAAPMSHAV